MLKHTTVRRRGMTTVETALVLTVFSMLLFGMFEYSRFLFVLHITDNAVREGARYATVNQSKPSTFDTTDYTDSSTPPVTYTNIQSYTTSKLGGVDRQLNGYAVAVYAVDSVGLTLSPPVIRPKSTSTTSFPDPFNASDPLKVAWNQASFPDKIAVSIKGTYTPFLPSLLYMPTTIPFYVTGLCGSEG